MQSSAKFHSTFEQNLNVSEKLGKSCDHTYDKSFEQEKTIEKRTLLLGSTSGLANQRLHEPHAGLCPVSLGSYVNTVFIRVKSQNFVAVVHLESRESHEVTSITINGLQISVIIMLVCDIYNKSS